METDLWLAGLPVWVLLAAGALLLIAGRLVRESRLWGPLGLAALFASGAAAEAASRTGRSEFAVGAGLLALLLAVWLNLCRWKVPRDEKRPADVHGLLLWGAAGALLVVAADELLLLVVGLELCGLAGLGAIVATRGEGHRSDGGGQRSEVGGQGSGEQSTQSAIRNSQSPIHREPSLDETAGNRFLPAKTAAAVHGVATLLLLAGLGTLYGTTAAATLSGLHDALTAAIGSAPGASRSEAGIAENGSLVARMGFVMLLCGLAVRLFLVPFHFGTPQVLSQCSFWSCAYAATLPRLAAFVVLFRLGLRALPGFESTGLIVALTLATGTIVVGTALAAAQERLRRTLVYLIVGQGGLVMLGFSVAWGQAAPSSFPAPSASAVTQGVTALALSLFSGLVSFAGILALLSFLRSPEGEVEYPEQLKGLIQRRPLAGAALVLLLLNLAGVPPLPGFWARLATLLSALSMQTAAGRDPWDLGVAPHPAALFVAALLIVHVLLTAAVAVRLVGVVLFDSPLARPRAEGGRGGLVAGVTCAALLLFAGLSPATTMDTVATLTGAKVESPVDRSGGGRNRRTIGARPWIPGGGRVVSRRSAPLVGLRKPLPAGNVPPLDLTRP